ncbi:hypothetical protein [Umezawaea sp.]|uniref:hypothetical protein n=1 Tax=Umezawaea sp. TaxID=1955258 RepID=UPI002ED3ED1C
MTREPRDLFTFAPTWTRARVVDGGRTEVFRLDAGGGPLSWTLRGPARHRWNGAVVTISAFRKGLVAKHATTTEIPILGGLVDSLVRKTAEEVLDVVTWHGRLSITFAGPGPTVVLDETRLGPRVQRWTVPLGRVPSTLLVFDGDADPG